MSPPANAGDMSSAPGPRRSHMLQGNYVHAPQLLSPHALELRLHRRSHHEEKLCTARKSSPCLPQLEKAHVQQRPRTAVRNERKTLVTF